MSENIRNAGVVYGTRGEIFDSNEGESVEEFVKQTFGIENVFENKLVMGRCICNGKKDLETDVLLPNSTEAENFMFSKESTKPHVVLIYDKPELNKESDDSKMESDVLVSAKQWEELVASVRKLQLSMETQHTAAAAAPAAAPVPVLGTKVEKLTGPAHEDVTCDACYPLDNNPSISVKSIVGPRFKCLDCIDFDLCSSCEAKGTEIGSHRRHHNMAKINTPLKKGARYDMAGLSSMALNDREIIVDIPEHERDIFQMFSSVEAVREVIRGYRAFCTHKSKASAADSKPRTKSESTSLEITVTRRDNLLTLDMFNNDRRTLPGGCTLAATVFASSSDNSKFVIECYLGPHELRPGNKKIFHKQIPGSFQGSRTTVEISKGGILFYSGSSSWLLDNCIKLRTAAALLSSSPSSSSSTPENGVDYKSLSLPSKEDEGVISSSMTNDEYSLCSESSNESNWGDYDFLSEDDI